MILRTEPAKRDLAEIWLYIALDSPGAADHLVDTIDEKLKMLEENPRLGTTRDDLLPSVRAYGVGSYLLFYKQIPAGIELLRVLHGARTLRRLLGKRKGTD